MFCYPVRFSYNSYFSTCFFNRNNVFLSYQTSEANRLFCGIASSVRHPVHSKPTCCRAVARRRKMACLPAAQRSFSSFQTWCSQMLEATCLSCQLFCSKLRYLCILDENETEERIPCSCSQRSQRHAKLFKLICHAGLSIILHMWQCVYNRNAVESSTICTSSHLKSELGVYLERDVKCLHRMR